MGRKNINKSQPINDVNDFSKKKSNQKMKTRQIWKDTNKQLKKKETIKIKPNFKTTHNNKFNNNLRDSEQLIQQIVMEYQQLQSKSEAKIKELEDQVMKLKAQIDRKNKIEDENIGKCKVCLEKPAIFANVPCMHVNLCVVCAEVAEYKRACITCRQVGQYKKIFF